MSSLKEYFHTDWAAMTTTDWIGTILTVVIFLLMMWRISTCFVQRTGRSSNPSTTSRWTTTTK